MLQKKVDITGRARVVQNPTLRIAVCGDQIGGVGAKGDVAAVAAAAQIL